MWSLFCLIQVNSGLYFLRFLLENFYFYFILFFVFLLFLFFLFFFESNVFDQGFKVCVIFGDDKTKSVLFASKRKIKRVPKLKIKYKNIQIKQYSKVT